MILGTNKILKKRMVFYWLEKGRNMYRLSSNPSSGVEATIKSSKISRTSALGAAWCVQVLRGKMATIFGSWHVRYPDVNVPSGMDIRRVSLLTWLLSCCWQWTCRNIELGSNWGMFFVSVLTVCNYTIPPCKGVTLPFRQRSVFNGCFKKPKKPARLWVAQPRLLKSSVGMIPHPDWRLKSHL